MKRLFLVLQNDWRAGMEPRTTEDIAEMNPGVIQEIAQHAANTGLVTLSKIEQYFRAITGDVAILRDHAPQFAFASYKVILTR